jgi:hypothetical protein
MAKPEGGRFDEDTYARAKAWMEKQGEKKAEAPKPAAKTTDKDLDNYRANKGQGPTKAAAAKMRGSYPDVKPVTAGANEREMNKYRDRAVVAGTAAASLVPMGRALTAASAPSMATKKAAMREMTKAGPKAASKAMPSRPTAQVGKKNPMPAAQRRAEEGFSPAEANRMLARKQAAAKATKPSAAPAKPKASATKPKADPRSRTRYNQDEKNVEFRKGGVTKKGYK